MYPSVSARAAVALALLCIARPATAQAPGDDSAAAAERARLEAELAAELAATQPPQPAPAPRASLPLDLSAVGTFVASWFSDEPTLRLPAHEPSHRGPELQEIELALRSNIDPWFRGDLFLALSLGGIEVEEAYVTTLALPFGLQLRGGSFYAPFGRFNQQHFLEVTPFADIPLPNRRFFGGEQLRGLGAEVSLLLPLPFYAELRAASITAGNELSFGVPAAAIDGLRDLLAVGRLLTSFDPTERLTLNLGLSAANGPNAAGGFLVTDENRTDLFGADLYLRLRDASSVAWTALQAEAIFRRATVPGGRLEQGGVYAWLSRRFDRHWEAAFRWDLLAGGEAIGDPHVDDAELARFLAPAHQQRIGASVSRWFSEYSRLRLQANRDFGLETEGAAGAAVTEVFLQFQFAMGAHGAHPF